MKPAVFKTTSNVLGTQFSRMSVQALARPGQIHATRGCCCLIAPSLSMMMASIGCRKPLYLLSPVLLTLLQRNLSLTRSAPHPRRFSRCHSVKCRLCPVGMVRIGQIVSYKAMPWNTLLSRFRALPKRSGNLPKRVIGHSSTHPRTLSWPSLVKLES